MYRDLFPKKESPGTSVRLRPAGFSLASPGLRPHPHLCYTALDRKHTTAVEEGRNMETERAPLCHNPLDRSRDHPGARP